MKLRAVKESAGESMYYGQVTDIIELSYPIGKKFVLFKCNWVDVEKGKGMKEDKLKFTLVNFTHLLSTQKQEAYVLASQVNQVFYVEDPTDPGWHVVVTNKPRDTFDLGGEDDGLVESTAIGLHDDNKINLVRDNVEELRLTLQTLILVVLIKLLAEIL